NYTLDASPPSRPSEIVLVEPDTNPGFDSTPTVKVAGVVKGDNVFLYSDKNCLNQIAFMTSTSVSAEFKIKTPLTYGTTIYSANSKDKAGNISECTEKPFSYIYKNRPPIIRSIASLEVEEGMSISNIDIEDEATGKDKDRDGETISYSCFFDKSEDQKVSDAVPCNKIQGLNFNTETGDLSGALSVTTGT
ncbi:hypothetical protein OAK75_14270, partial [Bacteriovoracales bacterium]|nr:hypothetical protein [Bacteriovoracales bacterium]